MSKRKIEETDDRSFDPINEGDLVQDDGPKEHSIWYLDYKGVWVKHNTYPNWDKANENLPGVKKALAQDGQADIFEGTDTPNFT